MPEIQFNKYNFMVEKARSIWKKEDRCEVSRWAQILAV